ncbi:hypothetical protein DVB69_08945 [Sporosarcina sp. BI001-red]|uniref:hypothetical protein n=1 Tax=Sporosarcina sp. BI001-red TaxID=2282866 RepID=UPI000E252328|nr:hypothetical protein [Sporosarcina sp. BI001-red]REB08087.1 hypothetical protein DVB69_08945 [Sporosarcina sp. BI001-red]
MLSRKILSASVSGVLVFIFLGFFIPNPFGETITSVPHYFNSVVLSILGYLFYGTPIIFLYGIVCSIISEKSAVFISKKIKSDRSYLYISGFLHACFGFVFSGYGLIASLLFFAVDHFIKNRKITVTRKQLVTALVLPIALYVLCLGTLATADFFSGGWKDLLV